MEDASTANESLDEDIEILDDETRNELLALPLPKASSTRAGTASNHVEQMTPLDQMVPRRLNQDPGDENDCCAHACLYYTNLLRAPQKASASKKPAIGGNYCTVCTTHHLEKNHTEEGYVAVEASLVEKDEIDSKCTEVVDEKNDLFHQEKDMESVAKKRENDHPECMLQKVSSSLSHQN